MAGCAPFVPLSYCLQCLLRSTMRWGYPMCSTRGVRRCSVPATRAAACRKIANKNFCFVRLGPLDEGLPVRAVFMASLLHCVGQQLRVDQHRLVDGCMVSSRRGITYDRSFSSMLRPSSSATFSELAPLPLQLDRSSRKSCTLKVKPAEGDHAGHGFLADAVLGALTCPRVSKW